MAKDQVDIGNKYAQDTLDDSADQAPLSLVRLQKVFHLLRPFAQGLNVVLHNCHVLLKSVGALNQGVVLLDTLREQINLDPHHRPVTGVGAQHAYVRDNTADKSNINRFQATP